MSDESSSSSTVRSPKTAAGSPLAARLRIRWRSAVSRLRSRSVLRYLAGVAVVSLGASLGIRSGAGAAPYDAFLVTLSERFGFPYWVVAWGMQSVFVAALLRLRTRPRASQLAHSLLFGPVISVSMAVLPEAPSLVWSVGYVAAAVVLLAVGIWLYLGAGFFQGMLDTAFESASKRFRLPSTTLRLGFDVLVFSYAWMGSGPVGWGTVAVAFGVAPLLGVLNTHGLSVPSSWRGIGLRSRILPAPRRLAARSHSRMLSHFADPSTLHPTTHTLLR